MASRLLRIIALIVGLALAAGCGSSEGPAGHDTSRASDCTADPAFRTRACADSEADLLAWLGRSGARSVASIAPHIVVRQ